MIKFLKVNDPYRFAVVTVGFLLVRLVIFLLDLPIAQVELRYFLSAKSLVNGKWLYKDIWETTEPLSVLMYYILPKNIHYFKILSYWINVILILYNSFYSNYLLKKLDVFSEKSFLPGFFYFLFSLIFIELDVLSPTLLASTFFLYVIYNIFSYLKKEDLQKMYDAGFFLGIASLFYFPCIVFLIGLLASLLFFTRSDGRSYFLLLLGFFFPWAVLLVVFLWVEGLMEFLVVYISHYYTSTFYFIQLKELPYVIALPALLFIVIIIFSIQGTVREINYQSLCRRFMVIWTITAFFCCLISPVKSYSLLYLLFFPGIFFYTFYCLQIKKQTIPNIAILSFLVLSVVFQYLTLKRTFWKGTMMSSFVSFEPNSILENKNMWVSGTNNTYYLNGRVTTRYLNWTVSKDHFNNTHKFFAIENIRKEFYKNLPDVIVDEEKVMPGIFQKIPSLKSEYEFAQPFYYIHQRK